MIIALTLFQSIGAGVLCVVITSLALAFGFYWHQKSNGRILELRTDLEPQDLKDKSNWFMCAWCKIHFSDDGQTSVEMPADWDGVQTSHGMCPKCAKFQIEEIEHFPPPPLTHRAFLPTPSSGAPLFRSLK